jgi:hypothetical protein
MLHARRFVEEIAEAVDPDELLGEAGRALFAALVADPDAPPEQLAALLDADGVALLERLLARGPALGNPDTAKERTMTYFRARRLDLRMDAIQRELQATDDDAKKTSLLAEKHRLRQEQHRIRFTT